MRSQPSPQSSRSPSATRACRHPRSTSKHHSAGRSRWPLRRVESSLYRYRAGPTRAEERRQPAQSGRGRTHMRDMKEKTQTMRDRQIACGRERREGGRCEETPRLLVGEFMTDRPLEARQRTQGSLSTAALLPRPPRCRYSSQCMSPQ